MLEINLFQYDKETNLFKKRFIASRRRFNPSRRKDRLDVYGRTSQNDH
ncbi:unnamed protein product [Musa textilis]